MGKKDARIDAYIAKSADFAKPIMTHLRELIHAACPDVEETWKWSFPHFMYGGAILCSMASFKEHCAFGFWKAALMQDTDNALQIKDREAMGNLGRIQNLKDLPKDGVMKKYIKTAMKLNDAGVKLPPKSKATAREKSTWEPPGYFVKALKKNKQAERVFNEFSYSKKKEYIEWFEEAKTEATKEKRMAQALEWIAEGKQRHWKYVNC
ncbi:MAG: hypothetical protein K0Q79_2851 [Flavipsychrobacter sp.]|jgi:uncharacterized protein YdeI (YjbR/CyaY-like superfamily)|nr:hypothetical protein [Flavipsychrobacter sp.]